MLGVDFMSENVRAILDEAGHKDVKVCAWGGGHRKVCVHGVEGIGEIKAWCAPMRPPPHLPPLPAGLPDPLLPPLCTPLPAGLPHVR